jgi:hypothetical protein
MRLSRARLAWFSAGALLITSQAQADVASCVAAHSTGQAERNEGRLQSAKQAFITCSTSECPNAIQTECVALLAELETLMASVVFAAVDAEGADAVDVKVKVDGNQMLERLNGLPITLDPGSHAVVFTWPDGFEQTQTVVVAQGEKNRRVELRRPAKKAEAAPGPVAPSPQAGKTPVAAYVLAGVGVVALGSFAAFALSGKSAESAMDGCKPACTQAQVDKMRLRYLLADVSLGVGVAALGASGYLYFSAAREPNSAAFRGGSVAWRGTF